MNKFQLFIKKNRIRIFYLVASIFIFLIATHSVHSLSEWDRPQIFTINETQLNETLANMNLTFYQDLQDLESQIGNETQNRILNDSYLQSQINNLSLNVSQIYNILSNHNLSIENLYDLYYNMSINITNLQDDVSTLQDDVSNLQNDVGDLQNDVNDLQNSVQYLNDTILLPNDKYFYNDTNYFYLNESELNTTINSIAENIVMIENTSCSVISGNCSIESTTILNYIITKIEVIPTTLTNKYYFEMSDGNNNIIDKNRKQHTGNWIIDKYYAINDTIKINLTTVDIDENFTILTTYINNGVQ